MENKNFKVDDVVVMKKNHACGENKWKITRDGVDIKLKCLGCNHEIMMDRLEFKKKIKEIKHEEN